MSMKHFHPRIAACLLVISLFALGVQSQDEQTEEEKEFEKQVGSLMTSVIDEVPNLRLWENRALLYSGLGNMLWDKDQKQAKQLFDLAGQELANGIDPPELQTTDWNLRNIQRSNFTPRRSVILTISKKDPVSALEILKSSRPRKVQEAIDKLASFPKDTSALTEKQKREATGAKRRANWELSLEQAIAEKAAETDPKVAAALLKESLKKGVSNRVVKLLEKIAAVDMELARNLKSEVVAKLLDAQLGQNDSSLAFTLRRVLESSSDETKKESVYEKSDLTAIANRLADYYIKQKTLSSAWGFQNSLRLISIYAPNRKSELERKQKQHEATMRPWERDNAKYLKILNDKSLGAKDIIKEANELQNYARQGLYSEAIKRASKSGELNEIRTALENSPSSAEKDKALNELGELESKDALKSSDTEKIEQILDSATTDIARIKVLSSTAVALYKKEDEEHKKRAIEYLDEAKDIAGDRIVTREDVFNQFELLPAVAVIEPTLAFDRFEKLVNLVNRLTAASAVMREFDSRTPYIFEGEYFFPNIFAKTFESHGETLRLVAEEDLGELLEISRRFTTSEFRLLAQFVILQSLHGEKPGFPENRPMIYSRFSSEL